MRKVLTRFLAEQKPWLEDFFARHLAVLIHNFYLRIVYSAHLYISQNKDKVPMPQEDVGRVLAMAPTADDSGEIANAKIAPCASCFTMPEDLSCDYAKARNRGIGIRQPE